MGDKNKRKIGDTSNPITPIIRKDGTSFFKNAHIEQVKRSKNKKTEI